MLLVELGMLVYGIVILARGKLSVGKDKVLTGRPAKLCGVILISPIPLSFLVALILAIVMPADMDRIIAVGTFLSILIIFAALIATLVVGKVQYKKQKSNA